MTTEPKIGAWIKTSERLPESGAVVLVILGKSNTVSDFDVARFRRRSYDPDYFCWDCPYCRYEGMFSGGFGNHPVLYWQPLPLSPGEMR